MNLIKDLIKNRNTILMLAKNDFKSKYAGSFLGIVWAFIQPCVTVLIYAFIFGSGLKVIPSGTDIPFLLYLIAGIIPWFFFNDAVNNAANCMIEYSYIIKKVVFNVNLLPIVKIVSALFVHVFFIVLGFIIFLLHGRGVPVQFIQFIYYSFCTFMLSLAISYITSAVVVFFKDMAQIVNIIMQFAMWLTPIMYDLDRFPSWVGNILKFNPMYYVVIGYRDSFYGGVWFFEHQWQSLYFWGIVIILFVIGTTVFKKLKPHFADVL